MLEVKNVKKSFGTNEILKGIDLTINKGEVVAIIGPSGSGKTTLLRCISFLERADEGNIAIKDISLDMKTASNKEIRAVRMNMGFVFQEFNLFRNKTVLGNVTEGLIKSKGMDKKEAVEKALVMLTKVGIEEKASAYPDELSGGQKQRVSIARALAMDPEVILFDEPTSALDPELTREVLDTMQTIANDGTTMLVVTHQMDFARDVANRVIFIDEGVIVEEGDPKKVLNNPEKERTKQFLKLV